MIEKTVRRIVMRLFPEISGMLHLPLWGKIVSDPLAIENETSTASHPLYAVDVSMLDDQGELDTTLPMLESVPLPASFAGADRGVFGFPQKDTLVELGFIRGLPSKPFIRTVLVENLTLPKLDANDVLIQQSKSSYQRATNGGSWQRVSAADITDASKNYLEEVEEIKKSVAGLNNHIEVGEAGTIWLGNNSDNVLKLLNDLMGLVENLATNLSTHKHLGVQTGLGTSGSPVTTTAIYKIGTDTAALSQKLTPIVE